MARSTYVTLRLPEELVEPLERVRRAQLRSRSSLIAMFVRDGLVSLGAVDSTDDERLSSPEAETATR